MKTLLLARAAIALLMLSAPGAHAAGSYRTWTGTELLQRWSFLNEECRGGSGGEATTNAACDDRNLVDAAL
jgi:hypothetical protein